MKVIIKDTEYNFTDEEIISLSEKFSILSNRIIRKQNKQNKQLQNLSAKELNDIVKSYVEKYLPLAKMVFYQNALIKADDVEIKKILEKLIKKNEIISQ